MRKLSLAVLAGTALAGVGATAAIAASSTIYLDYSNVIATGSSIFLNRLPIQLPSGTIIYKDVTIQLNSDSTGLVSDVSPIVQATSPNLLSANFRAGTYVLPSITSSGFAMTGPGAVPGSVMTKWEVNATPTKSQYCGSPAVFYAGPLSAHPSTTRLKAAGITSTEYSYGIIGAGAGCSSYSGASFLTGALVGFSQSGSLLTIASFTTYSDGKDHNVPVQSITYRLQ